MKKILRYFRALLRVLDVPSNRHPRLNEVAEQISTPVAVLCGLVWATFIAGYLAASDDGIRAIFAQWLIPLGGLLVWSTLVQILHKVASSKSTHDVAAIALQLGFALIATSAISGVSPFIAGYDSAGNSDFSRASRAYVECMEANSNAISYKKRELDRAGLELARCHSQRKSDQVVVTSAFMQGRLNKEQVDELQEISKDGCNFIVDIMDDLKKRLKDALNEKCPSPPKIPDYLKGELEKQSGNPATHGSSE